MDTTVKMNVLTDVIALPAMQGITWRGFQGEADFPKMVSLVNTCRIADGVEYVSTVEQLANDYAHLHNSDLSTDMLIAEAADGLAAYARTWWEKQGDGVFVGFAAGFVHPAWRGKGIGTLLLRFRETRLAQIVHALQDSGELSPDTPYLSDQYTHESEQATRALFEKHGYCAVRYTYEMVRPDLENIPDLPLPPGVEVRPYQPEHLRLIWEASNDAFQDHWGYIPDAWESYVSMQSDPTVDPMLWQVAWHGDEVVGMVLNFINQPENEQYQRLRGYTENICVRRAWRKQGLAKALIARSLQTVKDAGMTEAALGVDTQNTSGATHLYELMGYRVTRHGTIHRTELPR